MAFASVAVPTSSWACGLSPERFGLITADMRDLAAELMIDGGLDYLDMSLWDVFKAPVDPAFKHRSLIEWFADLPRGTTRLGVAGKIMSAEDARRVLDHGADFAVVGRAAGVAPTIFPN